LVTAEQVLLYRVIKFIFLYFLFVVIIYILNINIS
jgi:hypothetical protein